MDYKLLGQKIKKERIRQKLTQEKLAELSSVTPSYIGIIERGDKKLSIETLIKIATALNASIDYLLSDSLQISSDTRLNELLPIVKDLNNSEMDLIITVVNDIASHFNQGVNESSR